MKVGNQEGKEPVYDHYPTGLRRAILVHILGAGECAKCWEKDLNHYTDGQKVFKRIPLDYIHKIT